MKAPFLPLLCSLLCVATLAIAAPLPVIEDVELQPLAAQARRIIEATEYLGEPFSSADKAALQRALNTTDAPKAVRAIQETLDRHCLFLVTISPEMRVKGAQGPAKAELVEHGWRQFLVKVINESGTTAALRIVSPNAQAVHNARLAPPVSDRAPRKSGVPLPAVSTAEAWLELQTFDQQPLQPTLSGLKVEYRLVQLYSRDAGKREARFNFDVGQGTQDIGFRNEVDVLFTAQPARAIKLRVLDENKKPTTAAFTIRDTLGRVYPSQAKRLAPDFAFHPQVYRNDGESVRLPDGEYVIEVQRGPESLAQKRRVTVGRSTREWKFQMERWIDPAKLGWWSGDHHIHAAGCAHYTKPSEGVHAPDMALHCRGEDLKIGANLTWGPCFDYQKQFFTGKDDKESSYPYLLRYDIEVSGFGSHRSGHLCLLRLKEQMYPGGESSAHWPTLGLNTLRWAKAQGAVVGPAHSGWGLQPASEGERSPGGSGNADRLRLASAELPNYVVPPFNGIGANEYIMNVTHEVPGPDGQPVPAVDFISTVDTPAPWELNIWYHTLNAGFRTRISGETDFPCIYGERVGLGRSYVKLDGRLNYDDWCEGIRQGRNYVGDGKSHLMEFRAQNLPAPNERAPIATVAVGERGSELRLAKPGAVKLTVKFAARLDEQPNDVVRRASLAAKPYWDLERARVGDTRTVPVEVLVNGQPVARKEVAADGRMRDLEFEVKIERSSWVALRVFPSSHTNPIWVIVGDQPVRPSRQSIEWCLKSVDQCWSQKEPTYAAAEKEQARKDYEHARQVYRQRLAEATEE